MSTNNPIEALEKVNQDYIDLLNSKEYLIGKRIYKVKNALKHLNIIEIKDFLKSIKVKRKLKKSIKEDSVGKVYYNKGTEVYNEKCVVYSCITGGYDKISNPILKTCDFIMYTDNINIKTDDWELRNVPSDLTYLKGNLINRYCKMHPFKLFPEYNFSIYIDGNVQVVSDVTYLTQLARESKCGIAMHLHQSRNCIY